MRKLKVLISHVNTNRKAVSIEDDFNKQVEGWTILWKLCLFPRALLSFSSKLMNSDHGDKEGGYTIAQQYGLPLTKADLAITIT